MSAMEVDSSREAFSEQEIVSRNKMYELKPGQMCEIESKLKDDSGEFIGGPPVQFRILSHSCEFNENLATELSNQLRFVDVVIDTQFQVDEKVKAGDMSKEEGVKIMNIIRDENAPRVVKQKEEKAVKRSRTSLPEDSLLTDLSDSTESTASIVSNDADEVMDEL